MAHGSKRISRRRSSRVRGSERNFLSEPDLDDPPPLSVMQRHHSKRNSRGESFPRVLGTNDVLAPLPVFKDSQIIRPVPSVSILDASPQRSRASATRLSSSPPPVSTHDDSLFGRIFPNESSEQGFHPGADTASVDEASRARLANAMHQMLDKYYEFGASSKGATPQTQYRYQNAPPPMAVEVVGLPHHTDDRDTDTSQFLHRRESAHHHPPVIHSSPLASFPRSSLDLGRGETSTRHRTRVVSSHRGKSNVNQPSSSSRSSNPRRNSTQAYPAVSPDPIYHLPPHAPRHTYARPEANRKETHIQNNYASSASSHANRPDPALAVSQHRNSLAPYSIDDRLDVLRYPNPLQSPDIPHEPCARLPYDLDTQAQHSAETRPSRSSRPRDSKYERPRTSRNPHS